MQEMICKIGMTRADIAGLAGISIQQLNNNVSKGVIVEELKDGRFVTVRRDATYFNPNNKEK